MICTLIIYFLTNPAVSQADTRGQRQTTRVTKNRATQKLFQKMPMEINISEQSLALVGNGMFQSFI